MQVTKQKRPKNRNYFMGKVRSALHSLKITSQLNSLSQPASQPTNKKNKRSRRAPSAVQYDFFSNSRCCLLPQLCSLLRCYVLLLLLPLYNSILFLLLTMALYFMRTILDRQFCVHLLRRVKNLHTHRQKEQQHNVSESEPYAYEHT